MNKENTFLAYPSEAEEKCKFYVYMDENNRLYYLNKEYEKKLEDKNQEINRLNNTINELEKYIHNEFVLDFYNDDMPCELIINKMEKMIKELKDSD